MSEVQFAGYFPGSIGRIVELHGSYYFQTLGLGRWFETKIASNMSEFFNRYDESRDGFWTACLHGRVEGSITIDGIKAESDGAKLRWFIVSSELTRHGIGKRLMEEAVGFCREQQYRQIYLWTFSEPHAARHLYEKFGFRLTEKHENAEHERKLKMKNIALEKYVLKP